jgi:toxin FitB
MRSPEWVKPRPDPGLIAWLAETDEDRVFVSVVTLGELRYGIERMAVGKRRSRLDTWLRQEVPLRFERRVLSIDSRIADAWGQVIAHGDAIGRPIGAIDAFIAATVMVHSLTLVTRNVSDFEPFAKHVLMPWSGE